MQNEKSDLSTVCEMFEEVKTKIENIELKLDASPASPPAVALTAPALAPEDGEKIKTLTARLGTVSEQLARPLKHRHTIDLMSNWALIALAVAMTGIIIMAWVIRGQRDYRDNDLKYRYIKMLDGVTPGEIERLETNFTYRRNPDSIRTIRRRVVEYEQLVQQKAEKSERARLNASEAERLKKEAETVKKGNNKKPPADKSGGRPW